MTRTRCGAGLLLLLVGAWLSACEPRPKVDPESAADETIEDVVQVVVDAIEAQRPGDVVEYISYDFASPGLTYADAVAAVETLILRYDAVRADVVSLRVDDGGDARHKRVDAVLAFAPVAREVDSAPPDDAVRYRFELEFARRGARWQAISGRYARLEGGADAAALDDAAASGGGE